MQFPMRTHPHDTNETVRTRQIIQREHHRMREIPCSQKKTSIRIGQLMWPVRFGKHTRSCAIPYERYAEPQPRNHDGNASNV